MTKLLILLTLLCAGCYDAVRHNWEGCEQVHNMIECKGLDSTLLIESTLYLEDVPDDVDTLRLEESGLEFIVSSKDDTNVIKHNLKKLDIVESSLKGISSDVFKYHPSLTYLRIMNSHLSDIPYVVRWLKELQVLIFANNPMLTFGNTLFDSPIQSLYLENTKLQSLDSRVLRSLTKLKTLVLARTPLTIFEEKIINDLPNLKSINLIGVNLTCDCNVLWMTKQLIVERFDSLWKYNQCKDTKTSKLHRIASLDPYKYCADQDILKEFQNRKVDGGWSEWNGWSDCSSTCGVGQQTRQRICDNPLPARKGKLCSGDSIDTQKCMITLSCGRRTYPVAVDTTEENFTETKKEDEDEKTNGLTVVLAILCGVLAVCLTAVIVLVICKRRIIIGEGTFQKKREHSRRRMKTSSSTRQFMEEGFKMRPKTSVGVPIPGGNKGLNPKLPRVLPPRPSHSDTTIPKHVRSMQKTARLQYGGLPVPQSPRVHESSESGHEYEPADGGDNHYVTVNNDPAYVEVDRQRQNQKETPKKTKETPKQQQTTTVNSSIPSNSQQPSNNQQHNDNNDEMDENMYLIPIN